MNAVQLDSTAIQARAAKIRCLFLDIDGVMTDCKLYLTPDGEALKAVNVRDGRDGHCAMMGDGAIREAADLILAAQGLG